jgi:hypothetical protein
VPAVVAEDLPCEEAGLDAMTTQPETAIVRAVRKCLEQGGWYVIRHQAGMGTHRGLADLQAIRTGEVVMVEVKTQTGRLSEAQEQFGKSWQAGGGTFIVARSVDDVAHLVDCLPLGQAVSRCSKTAGARSWGRAGHIAMDGR